MADNTKKFISDESSSTISKDWVFSVAPTIVAANSSEPYKGMDQRQTSMQLRLMPYDKSGGGARSKFNITWPQFDTLAKAVELAQCGLLNEWDIAEACGDPFTRIFGEKDAQGLCQARILTLKRQPVMRDGSKARLQWYIEIKNGRGVKVETQTGGAYMKPGSFVETSKCSARLSDGQMKDHMFWGKFLMDIFNQAVKGGVLQGHTNLEAQKTAYKNGLKN